MTYQFVKAPPRIQKRGSIIESYVHDQYLFLKDKYPDNTEEAIKSAIRKVIEKRMVNPNVTVISYPSPGNIDIVKLKLSTYINNHKEHVIAPNGTTFINDPDNIPPSIRYCRSCRLDRKKYKNLMYECMEKGDKHGVTLNDGKQGLRKIKNNSMIGGNGFIGSAFYDKESFGAITSLSRNGVILSYSITEQCLSNNFYWSDKNKIYGYIITTSKHAPAEEVIQKLVDKYNLYIPTPEEATKRLLESAEYYLSARTILQVAIEVKRLFATMSWHQRVYVFYRRNLLNLFEYNSDLCSNMIDDITSVKTSLKNDPQRFNSIYESVTPKDVFNIPEDVCMMMMILYNDLLDYKTVNKDLVKEHPEIAREFAAYGVATVELLDYYDDIFQAFMYHGETLGRVLENTAIIRKATAVSDTDSIIFTMKDPITWYLKTKDKGLVICDEGVNASAYIVYMLSRILNIANRDMAIAKGAIGDNVDLINLKSEFLYAVFVKTDLGKHYFAKFLTKEGRRFKDPKLDVKGVSLQTSTLPMSSREFNRHLMSIIIDDVVEYGNVYEADLVGVCLTYEKQLLKSLNEGSLAFYANVSIKDKDQYKDANKSIYFNYEWWQEVFSPEYGDIHIPGKYFLVPLKDKIPRSVEYLHFLKETNLDIYTRYVKWLERVPKNKRLGRIPIPNTLTMVPPVLIPAINIRSIIYKNMDPAQLTLKQLGIGLTKAKQQPLFLDLYGSSDISLAI